MATGGLEARRVLVVRLGAIGDVLRVLPAVRRLRLERPEMTIGWAVENWVHPVIAGNPNVDELHVLNRGELRAGARRAVAEARRFIATVRAAGYDTVLDFHGRLKSGLVSRFSGAVHRIGYARGASTEGNHLFNNIHVDLADKWENRVLRFLHLLEPLGIPAVFDPEQTGVHLDRDVLLKARAWYERSGSPALAVYPGTSRARAAYGRWSQEKWADLIRQLARDGISSVLFWGPDDTDYARAIAAAAAGNCSLAPATSLTEMMAMLGCFAAFIGSNTAAMHMAWLQGVPTAVFLGPARPRTDAPLGPVPSRVLWAPQHFSEEARKRHQADVTEAVPVEEAFEAVRSLLGAGRQDLRSLG